jgi:hypothetical protein
MQFQPTNSEYIVPANQFNKTHPPAVDANNPNAIQFQPTNSECNDRCKKGNTLYAIPANQFGKQ